MFLPVVDHEMYETTFIVAILTKIYLRRWESFDSRRSLVDYHLVARPGTWSMLEKEDHRRSLALDRRRGCQADFAAGYHICRRESAAG